MRYVDKRRKIKRNIRREKTELYKSTLKHISQPYKDTVSVQYLKKWKRGKQKNPKEMKPEPFWFITFSKGKKKKYTTIFPLFWKKGCWKEEENKITEEKKLIYFLSNICLKSHI